MEFLKIFLPFLSSLAWPAVVLVVLFSFRQQVVKLWGRLTSLDVPGLKVTFDSALDRVEQAVDIAGAAAPAPGAQVPAPPVPLSEPEKFQLLADLSPSAAITTKWIEVDSAVRSLALQRGVPLNPPQPLYLIRRLRQSDIIGAKTANILDELRILRNLAAHPETADRSLSRDDASRFGELADKVVQLLQTSQAKE